MPNITVEGGPSNWRDLFRDRPGLAVTPENHDLLLAEREAAAVPVAEPEPPEEAPAPEPAPVAAVPRTPPRRTPPSPPGE